MTDLTSIRAQFVDYVRRQLVGPFGGDEEVIADPPNRRYLMGILFPRRIPLEAFMEEEGEQRDGSNSGGTDEESRFSDDPVAAANDYLPSSQGVSFFTTSATLEVRATGARYETLSGDVAKAALAAAGALRDGQTETAEEDPRRRVGRVWRRTPLAEASVVIGPDSPRVVPIWEGRADIHVRWRSYPHGSLVTVTLLNAAVSDDEHPDRHWDDMLLQVGFEVEVKDGGEILEYPSIAMASNDKEEEELRLIHRHARVFAIGHGCSPEWTSTPSTVRHVRTEVMPAFNVPRVSAQAARDFQVLDISWLADEEVDPRELVRELSDFVGAYGEWIEGLKQLPNELTERQVKAAEDIIDRLLVARDRMLDGVEVLISHPERDVLLHAFRLANRAMLMQMRHSKDDLAGTRHSREEVRDLPTSYPAGAKWYPFQLGFFLTTLRGLVDPDHPDRAVVDLIWFPTGGGKTEAYLLVAAFEIFARRLRFGVAGGGTAVISRYTLSLLTAQQFQRTASTIAACEVLRRANRKVLGDEPISVGLWVGQATTPNSYQAAREMFDELREAAETDERFLLERCPWCGTEIVPRLHSEDDAAYGITCTDTSFTFRCTYSCPFSDELPVRVVDDDLYDRPVSFLLGTVDKFAQLAWVAKAGRLFGTPRGLQPPSLIIQDELHLLTGPLGTTVGLYEAAINLLCENNGCPPKVISSTATIRRASAQISGLFGRPVHLFPPTGIDADDSYFACADRKSPGRLYIGMMAQGHTSDTSVVHTATALLQAPIDLKLTDEALDAYWSLVVYHSSLRELGRTVTMANDDVNARLDALISGRPRRKYEVDELSSSVPRALQPRLLERLGLPFSDPDAVDFLATTNMLSVGVDVSRLGLMLVNGQPKSTAEYIQATSRVGRATVPGLVFGLFRATKPRDRSHYENFRAYHSALYRHVEPTTVTPFSPPSRDRALHAALVVLVRHRLGLSQDADAGDVLVHEDDVRSLAAALLDVVERVEPRELRGARTYLEGFIEDWLERAGRADAAGKKLHYKSNGKGQMNLIKQFNESGDAWPTLGSMRNVDRESLVEVFAPSGKVK